MSMIYDVMIVRSTKYVLLMFLKRTIIGGRRVVSDFQRSGCLFVFFFFLFFGYIFIENVPPGDVRTYTFLWNLDCCCTHGTLIRIRDMPRRRGTAMNGRSHEGVCDLPVVVPIIKHSPSKPQRWKSRNHPPSTNDCSFFRNT